jgi:hypothetical protein
MFTDRPTVGMTATNPNADQARVGLQMPSSAAQTETTRDADQRTDRLLHEYEGQFLGFGTDGAAITTLENEDGDEREIHFRGGMFRRTNLAPGSRFTYAIYETEDGSRSEIRPHKSAWPSSTERSRVAEQAREIVEGLTASDDDAEH